MWDILPERRTKKNTSPFCLDHLFYFQSVWKAGLTFFWPSLHAFNFAGEQTCSRRDHICIAFSTTTEIVTPIPSLQVTVWAHWAASIYSPPIPVRKTACLFFFALLPLLFCPVQHHASLLGFYMQLNEGTSQNTNFLCPKGNHTHFWHTPCIATQCPPPDWATEDFPPEFEA